jgi:Flp pilus assembly protein TadD
MRVLLCLLDREGQVVLRRALFDECWGGAPVGDDSLNRVLMSIRQGLTGVGVEGLGIETIPGAGYRFAAATSAPSPGGKLDRALEEAFDCWRSGAPIVDLDEVAALEALAAEHPADPRLWGRLALLLRKAAEYAGEAECSGYVARCERACRRAFDLDPGHDEARVALAGLGPLFGNWSDARGQLLQVLSDHPDHVPARHDLAMLEMATGRPSVASPMMAQLMAEDAFAPTFQYKRMYQAWSVGDVAAADRVAARALQLWPRHPAIWSARFWILTFTGRADQAMRLASDDACPPFPAPMTAFLAETARLRLAKDGGQAPTEELSHHLSRSVALAAQGPAQAVSALMGLGALSAVDEAFDVARAYFLLEGSNPSPLRRTPSDPSITDQHRRVTQPLFTPAGAEMREDARFLPLCEGMGLVAYWNRAGVTPDFMRA